MITETGIWGLEEAMRSHCVSSELAVWLAKYLDKSILVNDLGCGNGFYSDILHKAGFSVFAYEGTEEIDKIALYKPITIMDLSRPFLNIRPGQVICLEVGEHIPEQYEQILIDNISYATLTTAILSWAVPDQPGVGHVNCKDKEYIISEFGRRGLHVDKNATAVLRAMNFEGCHWFNNTIFILIRS